METIGVILALALTAGMAILPFLLFALLWREAGRRLEERDGRRGGARHAW